MEEVENVMERALEIYDNILLAYDNDVKDLYATLNKVVEAAKSSISSTQKSKKKPKRLQTIDSTDSENSLASDKEGSAVNPPSEAIVPKTFPSEVEPRASSRPVRAAKLKVEAGLKEPPLKGKLRRPRRLDSAVNSTEQKIKEERKSAESESTAGKNTTTASEVSDKLETMKRLSNEISSDQQKEKQPHKKVDESLVILNNNEQPTVEISDDETEKMPPPAAVPQKKVNKKKVSKKLSAGLKITKIKTEKESLGCKSDKTDSIQSSLINPIESEIENIKSEKVSDVRSSESIGEKKGPSKKRVRKKKQRVIKEEKSDDEEETKMPQDVDSKADSLAQQRPSTRSEKGKNASFESVYEDAVSENTNKVQIEQHETAKTDAINKNIEKTTDTTFVSTVEIPVANVVTKSGENNSPQETFIVENDAAAKSNALKKVPTEEKQCNDQTFVTSDGQHMTFVMNNDNKNKMPPMESNDATFNVNLAEGGKGSNGDKNGNALGNSILTEDESMEEEPTRLPKPKMPVKGGKKEIFNPFIESPVKKKVEAFEKHANTVNRSPPLQKQIRQTRQTKQQITKENKEPQNCISSTSKTTPNVGRNISRFLTPTQQNNITPNVFSHLKTPSSVSKIPNISKMPGSSKPASLSNESSGEDVRKTTAKLQMEERKKKREQKQLMATQLREAKEKERAEKLKKMMEEREEKARRKALEAEQQKRQLEEINRNLKLQEERREAQKRAEKQKLLEMAEAAKREREIMETIKMQKAKEKLLQERKLLEQKKLMAKKNAFNFNMLNSDDSTDDEEKTSSKRPPPPSWSKTSIRQLFIERQSHLPTKIIDSFFSVQPMTPDLRQIFPTLDSRYLKRNSSVFWKTPPRYSQLPKY